nr:putative wax ester synthase/acyl-CoA:diacylglycerol acyltransferase [uncultured bacterium]
MTGAEREIRQSGHMTETEALMWAAESDPWLSSGMGSVFLLDESPDYDAFVTKIEEASKSMLRLRERVVDGLGIAPPRWVLDDEFDIREHVRHVRLPSPGGVRELLDMAAQVFQDPFDVHRPLWQFVVVDGCEGSDAEDRLAGGIIMKLHHAVSDGIGAVRLAEMYLDFERHPAVVDASTRTVIPAVPVHEQQGIFSTALAEASFLARQQLGLARRVLAEVSLWGADPSRVRDVAGSATGMVKSTANQVGATSSGGSGSPLFRRRSRQRHIEVFDVGLDDLRAAGKRLTASVNDMFVAGSVLAVARYHEERGVPVDAFNLSFIMSTRSDNAAGGNSFVPMPFSVTGANLSAIDTLATVQAEMATKIDTAGGAAGDVMSLVAGFATMLPTAVLTRAGRARAAKLDWATSNLRGAPIPIYVAGTHITHMYPIGPLAGTAFNLTAMSYSGMMHFGAFIDPRAVDDPTSLRDHLVQAYDDLIAADAQGDLH